MLLALLPRWFTRRLLALCASVAVAATLLGQTPSALDGFDPNVDGNVFALATQADGRLLVAGQFSTIGGVPRSNLARLNADGSVDASFNPSPNGAVRALALDGNGRILIGGDFTALQPGGTGTAVSRGRLARVTSDGSLDNTFNVSVAGESLGGGSQLQSQVFAIAVQRDGSIVVGGSFATVQPSGASSAFNRRNLFRVSSTGTLDLGFDPVPNGMVLALAVHVDNKIIIAGGFSSLWPAGDTVPSTRNRIARLNANGTVDSEFNPNANNAVTTLAVQRDGKVLLGGSFTTLQPLGDSSPANRVHIGRLNPDGTLDSEFYPRVEGNVANITVAPDGGILVGGAFNAVWGRGGTSVTRNYSARFTPDGTVDTTFAPTVNAVVTSFAFQSDGKIVIGGEFTRVAPIGRTTPVVRNRLARLNADGSLDTAFELDAGGRPLVSITQADGKVVIGGSFTSVGGATHNYLARLNADGTVDATYNPDLNGRVYTLAYESGSNKVIIGGEFTTIGGETRNHIARLNSSGTIDSEFNPNINGRVGVILLQPDGKLLVGGSFSTVQPLGASSSTNRANILRLNTDGTLDTAFDPSANSSISAIALQSDNKVLIGGLFSVLTPGFAANSSAKSHARNFLARLNADGTLDENFSPSMNGQVSTIVVQGDKIIVGGAMTSMVGTGAKATDTPTTRNHIARFNADGTIDSSYDPNANGTVLTMALQSDGKLLIGGSFTTLQPNGRSDWFLRKYAARLNTDGTLDEAFNLDISEETGNRVDSLRVQSDGRVLIGGNFTSLQPAGSATRVTRKNFARLTFANGLPSVDTAFDPGAGGSTGAIVNALAVQADGKVIAVGNFSDLGGAKSTNIARFRPEGTPDPEFTGALTSDGPVNAVITRANVTATASQLGGFAWLNANGTLRSSFTSTDGTRLSGRISAIAVDADGRVLLGGSFANLSGTTAGNLVRFNANGTLDTNFNPSPNGEILGIAVQQDGRIIVVGEFTSLGDTTRNRIARINTDGSVDVTFDPNANAGIHAVVLESGGDMIVGGAFTSFTPNFATEAVTRNYLARVKANGTIDTNYNPAPNSLVLALTLQGDGKVIAGGAFTNVTPGGGTVTTPRNFLARFNTDGSLDQNFDPNANNTVNALAAMANGQIVIGGAFTTLQPGQSGTVYTRNYLARVGSDGAVDPSFNPNPNGTVTRVALQSDNAVLVAGVFTTLQPGGTGAAVVRNRLARVSADGALDFNFNPDVNGSVTALAARPDGSVLVGGNFTALQLIGSIMVGGNFKTIGGVPAQNLAMLNDNGSVNTNFQPKPDGAVNALLALPDGKTIVGGAFTNIAGAARNRVARFNADGTLDPIFTGASNLTVTALALQPDGKIIVGARSGNLSTTGTLVRLNANGSVDGTFSGDGGLGVRALALQADGRILAVLEGSGINSRLVRLNPDGTADTSFTALVSPSASIDSLSLQADNRVIVGGNFTVGSIARLARLNVNGSVDSSFNPAPNNRVTAVALQSDGRVVIGGSFTSVGGQSRVGIARLAATSPAIQMIGVSANRSTLTWTRGGTTGELSAVIFELSTDFSNWTQLGLGVRVPNTSDWQLTGLNLPASGALYIRARGIVPSSGTSSGIYQMVREFNFSNPVPAATQSTTPATAAAPVVVFDPFTGIAPRATLSIVAGEGTVEILAANNVAAGTGSARLANLSTRGRVTADNPLLLGFAISGTESRRVLVRAVGPGLTTFGVSDALAATRLQVYDASGTLLATNEGWGNASELAQTAVATGAFPLTAGSADSAAILSLAPGTYSIQVVDTRGNGGVALAEIYDAGTGTASRLVNVSSRGAAGAGSAALISGFVIAGDAPQRVLLRGVGPGLTRFGATSAVTDPSIALYDATGVELGGNDNWVSSTTQVSSAATSAGAFALQAGSKDAAVLATLPAGAYTTQVSATTTGTALLEIYEVR